MLFDSFGIIGCLPPGAHQELGFGTFGLFEFSTTAVNVMLVIVPGFCIPLELFLNPFDHIAFGNELRRFTSPP